MTPNRIVSLLLIGTIGLAGCAQQESTSPANPTSASTSSTAEESEISNALAELSEEDRALAKKQKNCPVSDEPLGSMGKPMKINLEGQDVFICCGGCEETLTSDPGKFLAKLASTEPE